MPKSFVQSMSTETANIEDNRSLTPKLRFKEFNDRWIQQTLAKTFSIFNGFAFSSDDAVEFSNCRWVKIADVGINEMTPGNVSYLPDEYKERFVKFLLRKGDY